MHYYHAEQVLCEHLRQYSLASKPNTHKQKMYPQTHTRDPCNRICMQRIQKLLSQRKIKEYNEICSKHVQREAWVNDPHRFVVSCQYFALI